MNTAKISENFGTRLRHVDPQKKVRVVLMLKSARTGNASASRRAKVRAIRESAASALTAIDAILERHDGRRLADRPDALGYLPVETTVAGVRALDESEYVRAILENQTVSLVR